MVSLNKGEWWTAGIGLVLIIIFVIFVVMNGPIKNSQSQVAKAGDTVTVNYTGKLADGTVFDSSYNRGQPFSFVLGEGQVIKGWDDGVVGMRVGDTKHLVIPPEDAYGAQGVKNPQTGSYIIPPNATLTFDVVMVSIRTPTGSVATTTQ